ncbi:aldo/keto reductase [Candidatus Bipolaricaulota bacterium]
MAPYLDWEPIISICCFYTGPIICSDPRKPPARLIRSNNRGRCKTSGVSNFRPSQVSLLQASCDMPLIANQVEINIHRIAALEDGTLNQCLELEISPEAWCPLGGVAYPAWGNTFTPEDEERIRSELQRQSEIYDAEPWVVILAWILAHPSNIFAIIGTTTPERVAMAPKALDLDYTREDWYRLLEARNGNPVP